MKVQMGDNGWQGIFIPGDNALAMANELCWIADSLDGLKDIPLWDCAIYLRRKAGELRACYQENQGERTSLKSAGRDA